MSTPHVVAIETKSFTSGDDHHAVVASVAATAGNQDAGLKKGATCWCGAQT